MSNKPKKRIYMDNSAATVVDTRVLSVMEPYWQDNIGNAGSLHKEGREARVALETARERMACCLHARKEQIVFTSGGTESNNLAILGTVEKAIAQHTKPEDIHVVTSTVEHNSTLDCFKALQGKGVRVTYIETDETGMIEKRVLENALTPSTLLVSLIYANNEIGTIQNAQEIRQVIRRAKDRNKSGTPFLHYDASQAPVWLSLDVEKLHTDLMTLDGQKLYGPKGVGCLYVRNAENISPILFGGGQEYGLRPGTPPLPLIAGFTKAYELVEEERDGYVRTIREMRDWFIEYIVEHIPDTQLNGATGEHRIAGNVNFTFGGIEGEQLVVELDVRGIAVSTGSACLSQEPGGSHVIASLHKDTFDSNGTIRFSFSRHTQMEEVEYAAKALEETVAWLRTAH